MSKKLRELQARKAKQVAALRLVTERADAEARDLTAEEQNDHDAKSAELETTNQAIAREERLLVEEASLGTPSGNAMLSVHDLREDDLRRGFSSFGDFAHAVVRASGAGNRDPRLTFEAAAPSTYGGELSGVDGGFAVPPQFAREIFTLSLGEDSFVPYTDALDIESNSMVLPKDETTPWGTDGIRAYWQAEATAANATKLKLGTLALRMHKLMALVPVSDELLEDTSAITNYLPKKVASSIRWKTNDAIINGTGACSPRVWG